MSREKFFPLDGGVGLFSSFSPFRQEPYCWQHTFRAGADVLFGSMMSSSSCHAYLKTPTSRICRSVCQPWFYLRLWLRPGHTALLGYPRGHRVPRETSCQAHRLSGTGILTLEPERFHLPGNRSDWIRKDCPVKALKLLVFSVSQRRNDLPSSKCSMQLRRSCAPGSVAPSPVSSRP